MDFKKVKININPATDKSLYDDIADLECFFGDNIDNFPYNFYTEDLPTESILLISTFKDIRNFYNFDKDKFLNFLKYNKILLLAEFDLELQWQGEKDLYGKNDFYSTLNVANLHRISDNPYSNADIVVKSKFLTLTDNFGINLINQKKQDSNGKFFCLMNANRDHRNRVINSLYNKNLLSNGKVVYHQCKEEHIKDLLHKQKKFEDLVGFNIPPYSWLDGQLGREYLEYALELIVETTSNFIFITEKTVRPLSAGMPFLMVSAPKTLQYLRDIGFQTYNNYIDESYDDELDLDKRIDLVTDLLSTISKDNLIDIRNKTKDMQYHNLENLLKINLNYRAEYIEKVYNFIKTL